MADDALRMIDEEQGTGDARRAGLRRQLLAGETTIWSRPTGPRRAFSSAAINPGAVAAARDRAVRFRPALAALFRQAGWNGAIASDLVAYPDVGGARILVKADHDLPVTGSIKARGGVYELLCRIEEIGLREGLLPADDYAVLTEPAAAERFARYTVSVASTGNLGFSIGLVARAFGLHARVHMSADAKAWKKERLIKLGAVVVEHPCDFNQAVDLARVEALRDGHIFIDDTSSAELLLGYSLAADEVLAQLEEAGVAPSLAQPLVVYLPCGVGGAPGGVTYGLRQRLGEALVTVFVEPVASACMMTALAFGNGAPMPVYALGLSNDTVADGLAVATASPLVLEAVGDDIDHIMALPDSAMLEWVRLAWRARGFRLEPSAAAALAAIEPLLAARPALAGAVHVAWTTGGSMQPDEEFLPLVETGVERATRAYRRTATS